MVNAYPVPDPHGELRLPPGLEKPRRFRPRLRYELIGCGLHGHELIGTDVAHLRDEDRVIARQDADGLRWYRCVRCDSWLPLLPPDNPTLDQLPPREDIELPLRGRALRDRYVLRVIAVDRVLHFLVLGILAAALILFAHDKKTLDSYWLRIIRNLQAGAGGPVRDTHSGLVGEVNKLFAATTSHLLLLGFLLAGYAVLEGVEAIGLWWGRRWAEYLTFVATAVLLVPEIYELTSRVTALKVVALIINLAVVIYLLFAKRLFGLRGGSAAEAREREADSGWAALERTLPSTGPTVPQA
jgi:uncharacterized membrane protein (DUF2068 family)